MVHPMCRAYLAALLAMRPRATAAVSALGALGIALGTLPEHSCHVG